MVWVLGLVAVLVVGVLLVRATRKNDGGGRAEQFEGWWTATADTTSPKLHGKIEWEPSLEGGTEIDLLVSKLEIPDGDEVVVTCEGTTILRASVQGGKARKIIKSSEGHTVPVLAGKAVELRHRDAILATAVLEPD